MKKLIASGLALLLVVCALVRSGAAGPTVEGPMLLPGDTSHEIAAPNDGILDVYFIGRRDSQIEPCGCQMKQRGGVQYESELYNQHDGRPSIRLDAGEWTRAAIDRNPVLYLQTAYLLRAMRELKEDAVNVSLNDLQFQKEFFDNLSKEYPGLLDTLISTNVFAKSDPSKLLFQKERIIDRKLADGRTIKIGITGATTLSWAMKTNATKIETGDYLVTEPKAALKAEVAELRPKVDMLVVLYSCLNAEESAKVCEALPEADLFVTTVYPPEITTYITKDGPTLVLYPPNLLGKELGVVSLKPAQNKRWDTAGVPQSLYVALDNPIDPKIAALIENFKDDTAKLDVKIPAMPKEVFAGADSCVGCHEAIYKSWSKTKHAVALDALINKRQQFNPECVKCHVTGFQQDNGFWSVSNQPSMSKANVQCEVCHGPAQQHVIREQQLMAHVERWKTPEEFAEIVKQAKASVPIVKIAASKCIECHQGENDPVFSKDPEGEFAKRIHFVNHSDVPEADRKAPAQEPVSTKLIDAPKAAVVGDATAAAAAAAAAALAATPPGPAPSMTPPPDLNLQPPATAPTPIVTTPNP